MTKGDLLGMAVELTAAILSRPGEPCDDRGVEELIVDFAGAVSKAASTMNISIQASKSLGG